MLTLNVTADKAFITGTANGQSYSTSYTPEKLAELQALADTAEGVTTPQEYKDIVAQFLAATEENFHALQLSKIPGVFYNASTRTYHLQSGEGDKQLILEDAMPQVLVDRLLYSLEVGVSVEPLIKFYTRLLRNPNYSPEKAERICWYINQKYTDVKYRNELVEKEGLRQDVAAERATQFQTPLTQEGLLATYKYATVVDYKFILDENGNKKRVSRFEITKTINEDTGEVTETVAKPEHAEDYLFLPPIKGEGGDAFYCGDKLGHFIKVGQVHTLPEWSMVDTNDQQSCVPGLHVGNKDYIRGYAASDRKLLEVFVDPSQIGAVVPGGDGALRVKEYFVYGTREDDFANKSIYHSSAYAAKTDKQWEAERQAIIEKLSEKVSEKAAKAQKKMDRLEAI